MLLKLPIMLWSIPQILAYYAMYNYAPIYTDLKSAGVIEECYLYKPCKCQVHLASLTDFMYLESWKIGCVNYAHFPKSGHK